LKSVNAKFPTTWAKLIVADSAQSEAAVMGQALNIPVLESLLEIPAAIYDADKQIHIMLKKVFMKLLHDKTDKIDKSQLLTQIKQLDPTLNEAEI
jgi:hypothetical protein